jgi:uncharacterized integral membrane protein (TIGR00697 family)
MSKEANTFIDPAPRAEQAYAVLVAAFSVVLVLTNVVGVKLFTFDYFGLLEKPITLTSGIVTYPLTFLFTDVVSELYGRKRADFMVILGFFLSLLMLGIVALVTGLPGSEVWVNRDLGFTDVEGMQNAFETVFTFPVVLVAASMTAYLTAQLLDNRLFHFWRRVTKGKYLWLRNNGSTVISQFIDTIIVNSIFLGWGMGLEAEVVWSIILANYACKVCLAALDTPLIYLGVHFLKGYLRPKGK